MNMKLKVTINFINNVACKYPEKITFTIYTCKISIKENLKETI